MKNWCLSHFCTTLMVLVLINGAKLQTMERSFVPLGETSHVSCEKTTSSSILSWIIDLPNGISEDAFSTDPALMARGITLQMDTSHLNLSMLASTENNGTVVTCRELFQSSEVFSAPILLIVIGPPLPPTLKATLLSTMEILLEWEEPFTWPDHRISGYSVQKEVSDGNLTTLVWETQNESYLYSVNSDQLGVACAPFNFKVLAFSDLGVSQPASITTGLPVFPGEFRSIKSQVRFQPDRTPEVTVTIEPPNICEYESEAELILVLAMEGGSPLSIQTREYSNQTQQVIVVYNLGLKTGQDYNLFVTASTAAGNSSTSITFDTSFSQDTDSLSLLLTVVISVCASLMAVLVAALLLVLLLVKFRRHRRRTRDCPPTDLRLSCDTTTANSDHHSLPQQSLDVKLDLTTVESACN